MRYMFGGKAKIPLVVRTVHGAGAQAAQHSQSLYNMFAKNTWCKSSRSF